MKRKYTKVDVAERFWAKVDRDQPDECWSWKAGKFSDGYGAFYLEGRTTKAHRVSYELSKGSVPEGLHLDHLCRNKACVNPDHLDPVTCGENLRRGDGFNGHQSRQTHCKRGHPLSGANLIQYKDGHRRCRTCERGKYLRQRYGEDVAKAKYG